MEFNIISTDSEVLTIEKFDKIPLGEIFAFGQITDDSVTGINISNSGKELLWIAKKGYGNDWCIYIHFATKSIEFISKQGDKVMSEHNIRKLVSCDETVFKKYRY